MKNLEQALKDCQTAMEQLIKEEYGGEPTVTIAVNNLPKKHFNKTDDKRTFYAYDLYSYYVYYGNKDIKNVSIMSEA